MRLYFVTYEKEWERVMAWGFGGDATVTFTTDPDARGLWGRRDELVCSVTIELPDEIAQQYADPGGRVYRVPAEIANQYIERPGRVKGAGG